MKKISTLLAICLSVALSLQAQFVVFGDALAPDVSSVPFGGSVNNVTIDNTVFRSGTSSIKINVTTGYTGGAYVSATPVNVSVYNAMSFWAKVSAGGPLSAATIDGASLGNDANATVFALERNGLVVTTSWQKFIVPIPVPSKLNAITGLFHFAEGSGGANYTIWIDDVQYETLAPGIVTGPVSAGFNDQTISKEVGGTFIPEGGTSVFTVNGANQQMQTAAPYFTWNSSNNAVATLDANGKGTALGGGQTLVTGMLLGVNATGTLTVNVTAPLAVPTVAAPNPTRAAYSVKSLFSGVYDNSPVSSWATDWSGCCRDYTEMQAAGNDIKKYGLRHFTGVQFDNVDATNLDTLHMDVWTPTPTSPFTVRLVNFAGATTEGEITTTLAGQQWVSLDLPLNQFKFAGNGAVMGKSNLQQMLLLVPVNTSGTFYVDNIYFYRSGASLPVNLADFIVTRRGNTSMLNWKTLSEVNSKGFSIERSINGTNWAELTFVNSKPNGNITQLYSTVDQAPTKSSNYYRLKQVDRDGKFTYSKVASLRFADTKLSAFSFYPNPAKNNLNIQLQAIVSGSASLQLVNIEGKMIRNVVLSSANSDSNINIDISNLTRGVYYLKLKDGPVLQTSKVMIN